MFLSIIFNVIGKLLFQGAVVCPSDEDSQTFTVNAANGESYRLKGISLPSRHKAIF